MVIGIPKEIKTNENRVSLLPGGVLTLKQNGHSVLVETKAGMGSGFDDDSYKKAGAEIAATASDIYERADMIMKVKEPLAQEYGHIRKDRLSLPFSLRLERGSPMRSKSRCVAISMSVQVMDRSPSSFR
jgi:alanine dehydrogenase